MYLCNDVLGVVGGGGFKDGVGLVGRYIVYIYKEYLFYIFLVFSVVFWFKFSLLNKVVNVIKNFIKLRYW